MPEEPGESTPGQSRRLAFALAIGVLAAAYTYLFGRFNPQHTSDFDQVWAAARALTARESPYEVIGYAKPFYWWWPFYYPLPAAILAWPLGFLPVLLARAVFCGTSSALLGWALTRDGWHRWPAFISMPFMVSLELAQWAPLVTAALLLPGLSWVGIAKPNWGLAVIAGAHDRRVWRPLITGTVLLVALSIVVQPGWPGEWLRLVRSASHFEAPVMQPFGFLMLLALLRWRRWEARLLVAICLLPQTPGFYDALVLFAIPRTFRESLSLTVAGLVVFFAMVASQPWATGADWMQDISRFTLWFQYLPCVAMVLARPNEGILPVPGWPRRGAAA